MERLFCGDAQGETGPIPLEAIDAFLALWETESPRAELPDKDPPPVGG